MEKGLRMSGDTGWERALQRYGDRLYRLAMLREPNPRRAGRAVLAAFRGFDWSAAQSDDLLEARLAGALPGVRQWFGRPRLAGVPEEFWRLDPQTRLALGLRLLRSYRVDEIGLALRQSPEAVRSLLLHAIADVVGDDIRALPEQCRASRRLRLDEPAAERLHVLVCDACRDAAERWSREEEALAAELQQATAAIVLPRDDDERIRRTLDRRSAGERSGRGLSLRWLQAAMVAIVAMIVAALVLPRGGEPTASPAPVAPRQLLTRALELYGGAPTSGRVEHRRYLFEAPELRTTLQGDVWTDPAHPARHRMQLASGSTVYEWQMGDGRGALHYRAARNWQPCGRWNPSGDAGPGTPVRWNLDVEEQDRMRQARWQFGPWGAGRRYLQAGLAASDVRSLGTGRDGDVKVVTVMAAGDNTRPELIFKLDAVSGELREVRELTRDNGVTRATTPLRLMTSERMDEDVVTRQSIFELPAGEIDRPLPIVDPACPLWDIDATYSVPATLARGLPPLVGLGSMPREVERLYLAGPPRGSTDFAGTSTPANLRLVYVGSGKRLTMRVNSSALASPAPDAATATDVITTGSYRIQVWPWTVGRFRGEAWPVAGAPSDTPPFWFLGEGWTRDELTAALGSARRLTMADWYAGRALIFDPGHRPDSSARPRQPAGAGIVSAPRARRH